jgi:hypothetical protein
MEIICQDALVWLKGQKSNSLTNIVTGIPDLEEVGMTSSKYLEFFGRSVDLIFEKVHPSSYVIFMVTDRKHQKTWIDKSFLISQAAHKHQVPLRWHKIILLRPVGSTHIQRPTYQHLMCFSRESGPGEATPDLMMCGKKVYKNASCPLATAYAINFLKRYSVFKSVIDPFVGRGTVLEIAQKAGFTGIGVDLDPKQCSAARGLLGISKAKRSTSRKTKVVRRKTIRRKTIRRKTSRNRSRSRK